MKRTLTLLLAVAMIALSALCLFSCTQTAEETLVIGITYYEPMNYLDENGTLTGFDTEFALAVCEKLGVKAEFKVIDWDNKFIELKSSSIDCIWNGMTITDDALKNADVSVPYVKNAQVVVAKDELAGRFSSLADMKDLSFSAESASAGEKLIQAAEIPNYTALADQSGALNEVVSGAADACVIDITMANAMTGEGTSYANLTTLFALNEEEYGIACRKGEGLCEKINEAITEMRADGSLKALADKYSLTLA